MSRADYIPGFSDADIAVLAALTEEALASNRAVQDLVRAIAAEEGIKLTAAPQPHKPKRRGRLRWALRVRSP